MSEKKSSEFIRENEEYRGDSIQENSGRSADAPFEKELAEGEYIIWSDRRVEHATLRELAIDPWMIVLPLCFAVLGAFITIIGLVSAGLPGLFGLVFVAFGLIMLRSLYGFRRNSYALTNRRVLEYNGKRVLPTDLGDIAKMDCTESSRGIGTVVCTLNWRTQSGTVVRKISGIRTPKNTVKLIEDAAKSRKFEEKRSRPR